MPSQNKEQHPSSGTANITRHGNTSYPADPATSCQTSLVIWCNFGGHLAPSPWESELDALHWAEIQSDSGLPKMLGGRGLQISSDGINIYKQYARILPSAVCFSRAQVGFKGSGHFFFVLRNFCQPQVGIRQTVEGKVGSATHHNFVVLSHRGVFVDMNHP